MLRFNRNSRELGLATINDVARIADVNPSVAFVGRVDTDTSAIPRPSWMQVASKRPGQLWRREEPADVDASLLFRVVEEQNAVA